MKANAVYRLFATNEQDTWHFCVNRSEFGVFLAHLTLGGHCDGIAAENLDDISRVGDELGNTGESQHYVDRLPEQ